MTQLSQTNSKVIVNHWLQDIGKKLNMSLCLDRDARCVVEYKKGIFCCIEVPKELNTVFIYAPLLPVPSDQKVDLADFLYQAMALNLFQVGTDGTTLAVDPESDHFVLCFRKSISQMDLEIFQITLAHFLDISDNIRTALEEIAENCQRD